MSTPGAVTRHLDSPRHLDIEGCHNVRDAGGWPTSAGRQMVTGALYRADDPVRLTARGQAAIDALGLRAVIDLRQHGQYERGHSFIDQELTHHIPTVDRVIDVDSEPDFNHADDIVELYGSMVERAGAQLARAVDTVAEYVAEGPVLVHCVAGKDRTGLVVALVQAAIGVTLDSIVAEYALSDQPTRAKRKAMIAAPIDGDPPVAKAPEVLWTAPAEVMARFAQQAIDLHGSLEAWPAALGVPAATIERLRARLLTA